MGNILRITDIRRNTGDLIDRVISGERLTIHRFDRPVAAIVSISDLERLEGNMNEPQAEYKVARRRTINQQTPGQFLDEFMATHDMTLKEVRRFLLRAIEAMDDLEDAAE